MTTKGFVYIWEYIVKEEYLDEFKRFYGPKGDWVQLFKNAEGYMATELHQDILNPKRFITVDFGDLKEDRDKFRNQFSEEFEILDKHCKKFTQQEKLIGDFNCYTNRFLM